MRYTKLCFTIIFNLVPGFYFIYVHGISDSSIALNQNNNSLLSHEIKSNYSERKERFFFIFPFYRILPGNPCTSSTNLRGVCLSQRQCNARGGVCSGSCANNKGVCCVYQKTCGQSTNANVTYFVNRNFPSSDTSVGTCVLTINKVNSGICQLRLDFLEFNLAEPNNGGCTNDSLSLGNRNLPTLCGTNEQAGQHVYIDLNPSASSHTLTVTTASSLSISRRWNIQISQISCNSSNRAPFGCLKYYTGVQGDDYSFNYSPEGLRNRQIAYLNYGVCVRPEAGYCGIQWSQASGTNTFSVSGDLSTATTTMAVNGTSCGTNYIVVPNPVYFDTTLTPSLADRFCGTALNSVISRSKPFVLTVVTGQPPASATTEVNKGFHLTYSQIPCTYTKR